MVSKTGTVTIHRVFTTPPKRLYEAFLNASALAKWLPPYGFTCQVHEYLAEVGGQFKMSFTNFSKGSSHSFSGEYLELIPHQRIRYTNQFDDANLPGTIEVSIQIQAVMCGSEIKIEQKNIPAVIPVEMCYLGWQESLKQLAHLVEPDIPG